MMSGCKGGLSEKLAQEEGLGELECTEWWYQWLSQALLIKAEQSVVLARFTRVPARDHYERIDQILCVFEASDVQGHY